MGLKAVERHIKAAIRHFDRENGATTDAFTDAIYRTNQAFEGGLKEAYRVLTDKDPSKLTPHQIESYLEKNDVIRPRALKQLTRYREDYRNPSTHDYKLDFDADEALLAIVAVCAFSKLLINQISTKISFDAGADIPARTPKDIHNISDLVEYVSDVITHALDGIDTSKMEQFDIVSYIGGALTKSGMLVKLGGPADMQERADSTDWDIIISHGNFKLPVEVRDIPGCDIGISIEFIKSKLKEDSEKLKDRVAILFIAPKISNSYVNFGKIIKDNSEVSVIAPPDIANLLEKEDRSALTKLQFKL